MLAESLLIQFGIPENGRAIFHSTKRSFVSRSEEKNDEQFIQRYLLKSSIAVLTAANKLIPVGMAKSRYPG